MKLNAGCSFNKLADHVNVDIDERVKPDIICDIQVLSFKENAFDYIRLSSLLEHVDIFRAMKEIYRVSRNGCIVEIWLPHWSGHSAWAHLEHKRGGSYFMFNHGKEKDYGMNFRVLERRILIEGRLYPYQKTGWTRWHYLFLPVEWLANAFPESFERLWCYWVGGAESLYFRLEAVK